MVKNKTSIKLVEGISVVLAAAASAFIFYYILKDLLINDPLNILVLLTYSPYFAYIIPWYQSQNILVYLLTAVIVVIIIVVWRLQKHRKIPSPID